MGKKLDWKWWDSMSAVEWGVKLWEHARVTRWEPRMLGSLWEERMMWACAMGKMLVRKKLGFGLAFEKEWMLSVCEMATRLESTMSVLLWGKNWWGSMWESESVWMSLAFAMETLWGTDEDGLSVGCLVGDDVDGAMEGEDVGTVEVGFNVGCCVGDDDVGVCDGEAVGLVTAGLRVGV